MNTNVTRGRAGTAVGATLIGLGTLFLISRIFDISLGRFIWPFFIIIPGALFFLGMVAGGKAAGPLAVPGSIVTMTGLILLFDSVFNAWANWSYIWALIFPTAVGIGLIIHGTWSDMPPVVRTGTRWTAVGMAILFGLGMLFEMVIYPMANVDRGPINTLLWPALLIGIGIWLIRRRHTADQAPAATAAPSTNAAAAPVATKAANGNGNGHKVSPVVGFEPIDPKRGKN